MNEVYSELELLDFIGKTQKRIAELEAMIIRLHNTHPQDIAGMLEWWTDMFKLMPIKAEGGADD